MPVRMTETAIQAAARRAAETGRRMELSDGALPGLRLRLTPAGARSWALACRDGFGAMRRFPLGEHPTLGIAAAREAARTMRAEVRRGADPVADARRKRAMGKQARDGIGTLALLLELYAIQNGAKLKSWPEMRRRIADVFGARMPRALATIQAADLQLAADAHPSQQSGAAGVRYIRPVLKWGSQRGYVDASVAAVHPPGAVRRRSRVLSREELSVVLGAISDSDNAYWMAMRFMLLTLTRRQECASARWRDFDAGAGTLTIPETKNGQPHVITLPRQAIDLLRARMPETPAPAALIFASSTGGMLSNWDRETKALMEASGTSEWHRHDLRRTGATMLGEMANSLT